MSVQGVSNRKVKAIPEELWGIEISPFQVSRTTAQLDAAKPERRERPLGEISCLYLDARNDKGREAGQVGDAAVLVAAGIKTEGERQGQGVSGSLSEHEPPCPAFLHSLKGRDLHGIKLIPLARDDHLGWGAAGWMVFVSAPWQRRQFHLQQKAGAYLPKQAMRLEANLPQGFTVFDFPSEH